MRNPLTLAISSDGGSDFDKAYALYNCARPKRYCGSVSAALCSLLSLLSGQHPGACSESDCCIYLQLVLTTAEIDR